MTSTRKLLIGLGAALLLQVAGPPARAEGDAMPESLYGEVRDKIAEKYGGQHFKADEWLRTLPPSSSDVSALVSSLNDRAVRLLPPDDARRFFEQMQSAPPPGIGLLELLCLDYGDRDGRMTVITPIPDTPAAEADIRTGDVIVRIDGTPTRGMSLHEAARALQGKEGSMVELALDRRGISLEKRVRRAAFPKGQPVVRSARLDAGERVVGYLGILRFNPGTASEVERRLVEHRTAGIDALVLDLRNNPGGAIQEAVAVAELFLRDGAEIASLRGRGATLRTFQARRRPVMERPMAVLINAGSASASEVVAGALQAAGRSRLFGERSTGKGLVHGAETLSDGTVLMMPVGRLATPLGADILGNGLTPDVALADIGTPVVRSNHTKREDALFWEAARAVVSSPDS